ncbi:MAG: hypothetical protein IT379_14875 [Deltaproteobacteria bacterium]|nr:hypothetical protein [Deltaproteobacteria bacterium]
MLVRGEEPLDQTFAALAERAPVELRDAALALPYRLGLTHRPHGGWGDFASLPPVCDLPVFAIDDPSEVGDDVLGQFRFAHRVGGFHGLLVDRVSDGQAVADATLGALRAWLRRERVQALGDALGDHSAAERWVARGERAFRSALAGERRARAERRLDVDGYVSIVVEKTRWIALPTLAMLHRHRPDRSEAFARGFRLFMLALQAFDDGVDTREDEDLYGVTVPALLGSRPDVLRQAARLVTDRTTDELARAGFHRFAAWSEARSGQLGARAGLLSAIGALALEERLVGSLVRASRRPRRWVGRSSEGACPT